MNKNSEKINKIKELYNKYKEAKKDPRKKAGMKLLGYFIFFLLIALIANISNEFNKTSNMIDTKITTTTTKVIDSYVEKQNDLLVNKYSINYEITYNDKIYKINGILQNNVITGYLEINDEIKKISLQNNIITVIYSNEPLEVEFDINNLNINNIINTIKQNSAFIKDKENIKTYLYELDNKKIYVECNEEQIIAIKIEELNNKYILNFEK